MKKNISLMKKSHLVIINSLIVIIVILGGYLINERTIKSIRQDKNNELKSIAELKIEQIVQWRKERLGDANVISKFPFIPKSITDLSKNRGELKSIRKKLQNICDNYDYQNILLTDGEGKLLFSLDNQLKNVDSVASIYVQKAISNNQVLFTEIHKGGVLKDVHISVVAPVLDDKDKPVGTIIFSVDLTKYLYRLIQTWPTPSKTAETLIIRKDGENVLFLNELRFRKNTSLNMRIPLTSKSVPAVQAVLGYRGMWDGKDYRNVDVLSYIDSIPGTPWFMISKIDKSEIFSELYTREIIYAVSALILILLLTTALYWIYHYRQRNLFKDLFYIEKNLRTVESEFKTTLYSIGDAVITTDTRGIIKYMNRAAEKLTGWNESAAKGNKLEKVFRIYNEKTRALVENPVTKVLEKGTIVGLANHTILISKDGKEIPINDSGAPIKNEEEEIIGVVLIFRDQTVEREFLNSLEASEAKFRNIFENSPLGKSMTGIDGSLKVNRAFCQMLGYSEKELSEKKWQEITHPDDIKDSAEVIKTLLEGEKSHISFEKRYLHKNGKIVWTEVNVGLIKDKSNNPQFFITTINDITEKKNFDKILQSEKDYAVKLIDSLPGLFYQISPEGKFVKWNKNFETVSGYSNEEMQQISPLDLFEGEDKKNVEVSIQKVFTEGSAFVSALFTSKDGTKRPYLFTGELITIEEKQYLVGMGLDIARRIEIENKLKESEKLFKSAFDSAVIGRAMAYPDGKFAMVNGSFCNMLGYSEDELLNKSWPEVTSKEFREINDKKMKFLLNGDIETFILEETMIHKLGHRIWVNLNVVLIKDMHGNPLHFVADIVDLTEIKKVQSERDRFFDLSIDFLCIAGTDGYFRRINPAWEKTFGWSEEEFLTKPFMDFVHPDDIQPTVDAVSQLSDQKKIINFINRYRTKDGSYRWLSWVSTPENDTIYAAAHDITDMKEAEKNLKKAMQNLESSNRELEAFNKMAVGREKRMIDLKRKINELSKKLGKEEPYDLSFARDIETVSEVNE